MKADASANTENLLLHAGWLRHFAVALVKDQDEAEDIVQETLVAAWKRQTENTGRAWLARVARNLAIDRWRSSGRREGRELAAAVEIGKVASPEELVGDAQIHRAVAEIVAEQSYDDFLTDADAQLKSNLSRQQFEGLCGHYTALLRKGYKFEYLGQLRQRGMSVYLWKITVVDGQDDGLIRLVLKDGKPYSFAVQ